MGKPRRCDFCLVQIASAGPAWDINRVGDVQARRRNLRFRLCGRCYEPLERVLNSALEARGVPLVRAVER